MKKKFHYANKQKRRSEPWRCRRSKRQIEKERGKREGREGKGKRNFPGAEKIFRNMLSHYFGMESGDCAFCIKIVCSALFLFFSSTVFFFF